MQPDGRPLRRRAHLHQVAHLIREPEAVAAAAALGRLPSRQRLVDVARVADLADGGILVVPDPHRPTAAAVANAVRRDLARRQEQGGDAGLGQVPLAGRAGDDGADRAQVAEHERRLLDEGGRIRQW